MGFDRPAAKKQAAGNTAPKGGFVPRQQADPLNSSLFQFLAFLVKLPNKYAAVKGETKMIQVMLQPLADLGLDEDTLLGKLIDINKPSHVKSLRYELTNFIKFKDNYDQYGAKHSAWAKGILFDLPADEPKEVK